SAHRRSCRVRTRGAALRLLPRPHGQPRPGHGCPRRHPVRPPLVLRLELTGDPGAQSAVKRSDLPTRGTGSRGPCKPGQVYWIEDGDETFLAVVVRAASTGSNGDKNDLMTVYLYPWPDDPPDDLAAIDPISRALIYT